MSPTQQGDDSRPTRIPLATSLRNRGESRLFDGRLVNAYVEAVSKEETWIYKRPGLTRFLQPSGGIAIGAGIYNWQGVIYTIFGGTLYANSTALGAVDMTGGSYTFSETLGSTPSLFLHNNTSSYAYNTTTGLQPVNTTVSPMVPGQAYLDATTYVLGQNALIQGSGINDLTSWPALNNLLAQIEPDKAVAMSKQLVYVIAFKQWSTEMFYDAGNAAGSPLGPVQGQKLNFGLRHSGTLADLSGALIWVNSIRNGGLSVMLMDQLSAAPVSSEAVERLLQGADFSGNVNSWTAKIDGHMFYGLSIQNSNLTVVYDLKQQTWYEWTDSAGNFLPIFGSTFNGQTTLLQHLSDGWIYTLDTQSGTDSGNIITMDVYTPDYDGGVRKKKMMNFLRFVGDVTEGNLLQVRVSDDDYRSWSNFRTVDMGQPSPYLDRCGTFRRRAWHIRQSTSVGGRILVALEPDLEIGEL